MIIQNNDGIRDATPDEESNIKALLELCPKDFKSVQEQIDEIRTSQLDIAEAVTSLYESEAISNG